MAFEGLTEKLTSVFNRLRGKGHLTESDVKEAMREIRLALLEADVSYKVVKEFVAKVTERAIGQDVMEALTPGQMVVKIVNEELTALMGGEATGITISPKPPTVIMMVGLQGAGKTTNAAKLAAYLRSKTGRNPLLAACDVYRPAAIKQLEVVGQQLNIPVFQMGQIDPVEIAKQAVVYARQHGNDILLLDTAGRLHVDETLMDELKRIKEAVNPDEIMLVVDAMIGQDAVNAAVAFDQALDISGVMLTKLDGDARGGAALSIRATTGKPIKFCGVGEKLDAIEVFHPDRMASRILGMGDVLTLIENAQDRLDEKKAEDMAKKIRANKFTLQDFYDQLQETKKMGSIYDILQRMPGMSGKIDESQIDEKAIGRTEAMITSMTKAEREDPSILNASRKRRIAAGSGTSVQELNKLLKQFEMMQALTKKMTRGRIPRALKGIMQGGDPTAMPDMSDMLRGGRGAGMGAHSAGRQRKNMKRKKKR
ncbi:MAG: signal recognition particle protein [Oscillospiraceae bacterium]|nr:signal recognition particle protein [Oscillospiraceae bacterium]